MNILLKSAKTRSHAAELGEMAKPMRAASAHTGNDLPLVRHSAFAPRAEAEFYGLPAGGGGQRFRNRNILVKGNRKGRDLRPLHVPSRGELRLWLVAKRHSRKSLESMHETMSTLRARARDRT